MNDQLKQNNNHEEAMDKALRSLSSEIDARPEFKSDLKHILTAHQGQSNSFITSFKRALPVLGWTMGLVVLALFLNWVIRGTVPTPPVPAAGLTITPTIEITITPNSIDEVGTPTGNDGYNWRGAKLYLSVPLPESPATTNIYQSKKDQQVTPDEARALAGRFGLKGEMYTAYDYVFNVDDYYFTDGKQTLEIYSNRRFTYIADLAKAGTMEIQFTPIEDAETIIREFLSARGFDFPVKITPTEFFGGYSVEPLTPDGLPIHYESFTFPPMLIKLDENGQVLSIDATLVDYDSTPIGTFGIISAQEAMDHLLNDNEQAGKSEFFFLAGGGGGGGGSFHQLNLSGTPIPFPSSTTQPNSAGGIYIVQENDTLAAIALNHGVTVGQLVQANGLPDPNRVNVGQVLIIPGLEVSTEQRVENLRGFLSITIHKSSDGSQLPSYIFSMSDANTVSYYEIEGSNLSELDPYNGLPIDLSGTIKNNALIPTFSMEDYSIPFPDLHFQIVKGTQQVQDVNGQSAILFTTEAGQTYVELMANTHQLTDSIIGYESDLIQHEALIVPDETYGSYPVIRVFGSAVAISPKDGQPVEMEITANQIRVYDDSSIPDLANMTPPSLTIDSIELEYFVNNPYYQVNDPNYERRSTYIQPIWHFQGHYEDGSGFDMLIQALEREFLSPQLSPGITPG